jgi:hypothetical protein
VLSSWQALLDYLRADMAHLKIERVRVLHLNARNMLIRDEHMGDGSVDQAAIYTREVIRRAIDLGSSSLILVHNHPERFAPAKQAGHRGNPQHHRGGQAAGHLGPRSSDHRRGRLQQYARDGPVLTRQTARVQQSASTRSQRATLWDGD